MESAPAVKLWNHPSAKSTRTWQFKQYIQKKHNVELKDYEDLRQWSIQNIDAFWRDVWDFTGVRSSKPFVSAIEDASRMYPRPAFFPGAKLNFAENLLYPRGVEDDGIVVIEANEKDRSG